MIWKKYNNFRNVSSKYGSGKRSNRMDCFLMKIVKIIIKVHGGCGTVERVMKK